MKTTLVAAVTIAAAVVCLNGAPRGAPQTPAKLPTVWILATGGTISARGATPTSLTNYKAGAFLGEEIVATVPAIKDHATVKVEQVFNVGSPNLTLDNWLTLARRVNAVLADRSVTGVVITHGTSTMEETAYFLNLTVKDDRPVVLVGSMRPATAISADGPLNLLNAVKTAVAPDARGKGVMIVLNDEINSARDATKTNTLRVETFRSPELGLLGYVDADRVAFYRSSTRRHTATSEFDIGGVTQLPAVDIVYSYVEPSPTVIRALVADDAVKGIVFAGTGAGSLSATENAALKAALAERKTARPILVRASRTGNGRVPASDNDGFGMISADSLSPQKARILLMLALTRTQDQKEIARMFNEY